ncbi:MAG: hypothetical protein GY953_09270, partial [bacterium]|nr:hypothetical protein [bacterium]
MKRLLLVALFVTILVAGLASSRTATPYAKWMAGDFHEHTYFTDGSHPIRGVIRNGFKFGLNWVANSEHGGTSRRDSEGNRWDDESVYPQHPAKGDVTEAKRKDPETGEEVKQRNMWRWQTLVEYVYPVLEELRAEFPDR